MRHKSITWTWNYIYMNFLNMFMLYSGATILTERLYSDFLNMQIDPFKLIFRLSNSPSYNVYILENLPKLELEFTNYYLEKSSTAACVSASYWNNCKQFH